MNSEEYERMKVKVNELKIRPLYKGEAQVKRLNVEVNSEFVRMSCDRNDCEGIVTFDMLTNRGNHFAKCTHCTTFYKLDANAHYTIQTEFGASIAEVDLEL